MLVKGAIPLPKESYSCGFLCDLLHRVEQKMTEIKTIKMDYLEQAVGTDGMPALSWVIQSDGVCVMQTAYQIQLSDQADFGQLLYDSKKVTSRESWIGCDSPVTFSEIYDGEIYDARLEQPGWSTSDFVPDIDQKFHYLTQEEKEALIRDPLKEPYTEEEKMMQRHKAWSYKPHTTSWHTAEIVPFSKSVLTAQPGCRVKVEGASSKEAFCDTKG